MAKRLSGMTGGKNSGEKTGSWIEEELAGCTFVDERLEKRFRKLFEQMSSRIRSEYPVGMPGLGEHEGCVPIL